ncbi:hypothetical protein [Nostoc punctiforme]|uniref:hypothetical protein n=1 Tax=Nostoc punctiforme TaxID=272131 RepID=UPI0011D142C3|nr:hypothetical protein [Nostoc punctiforme]
MTHRFDDDGGDNYNGDDDWEPGSHNNPCQLYDDCLRVCPFCHGKGKSRSLFDYKNFDEFISEKCTPCNGSGYR